MSVTVSCSSVKVMRLFSFELSQSHMCLEQQWPLDGFDVVAGLLCDLLWSDPDKDVQGWGENDRGVSFTFGADVVSKFLNRHDLDLITRAHQVCGLSISFIDDRLQT